VNEVEGNVFLLARAQIIDELETTVPRTLRKANWEPQYIHFLQVLLQRRCRANHGFVGLIDRGVGLSRVQIACDDSNYVSAILSSQNE
jgi:hypothetical protein